MLEDDDDINMDPTLRDELVVSLVRMVELVEEYYKHLAHSTVIHVLGNQGII